MYDPVVADIFLGRPDGKKMMTSECSHPLVSAILRPDFYVGVQGSRRRALLSELDRR